MCIREMKTDRQTDMRENERAVVVVSSSCLL